MDNSETFQQALERTGDQEQEILLTPEALKLTKQQVTDMLNGKVSAKATLSEASLKSVEKLLRLRINQGKSLFPWGSMEDVTHHEAEDDMGGGFW
jgi:hypothetical protein